MFTLFLIFFLLCSFSFHLFAQESKVNIHGRVTDQNKRAISEASVSLLSSKDSSVVLSSMVDPDGNYSFAAPSLQSYLIAVSCTGFKKVLVSLPSGTANGVDIAVITIVLTGDEKQLSEVIVKGKKPLVQIKSDRVVLNVASSINASGSNAFDLLRMAPGVRISNEESIVVKGKEGVTIYVDDRPTTLSEKNLQAIPSSTIESIEIINNPSSKYDAAGNAGVINVKTKKNSSLGFNANTSLSANISSYKPKYNGGIDLNYRKQAYNLYGSYNYSDADYRTRFHFLRRQTNNDGLLTYDQDFTNYVTTKGSNYKGGLDLFLSPVSTLGLLVNGTSASSTNFGESSSDITQQTDYIGSKLISSNRQPQDNDRINYNLNYRLLDTSGREFSVNATYGTSNVHSTSDQPNTYLDSLGGVFRKVIFSNNTISNIKIYSFNTDYRQRLFVGNISMGLKYSDVKSNNNLLFYRNISGVNQLDTGQTNQFIYKEQITAGYLMYDIDLARFKIKAGLRAEHTASEGTLTTLLVSQVQAVKLSYTKLFPNIVLAYDFKQDQSLSLSYNRRIDRPDYRALNPFVFVIDDVTSTRGNPFLRPQVSDNLSISQTFNKYLSASFDYSYTKDKSISYIDTVDRVKSVETRINLDYQKSYDLGLAATFPVTGWWNSDLSADLTGQKLYGLAGQTGLKVNKSLTSVSFSTNQSITLPHNYSAEISGYYNSKTLMGVFIVDPQWSVDLGLQKKILGDDGTVRLGLSDVFNSLKLQNIRDFGGYYIQSSRKWETQLLKVGFSYRFGNKKVKDYRKIKTAAEEEQKRSN
jgi:iron complex outermembrane receptor protein